MSDHPHTPGPWKAQESGSGMLSSTFITDPRGDIIASMMGPYRDNYDARLIAAAPEMLAILEEILPDIECRCGEAYTGRGLHESNSLCHYAETIKAAIAKATGKEAQ